jgi:hypothetical protein
MSMMTHAPTNVTTPCPPWCTLPRFHGPDTAEPDGTLYLWHRAEIAPTGGVRIVVRQAVILEPDGRVTTTPPEVEAPDAAGPMGLGTMRLLAAGLTLAAELVGGTR